MNELKIWNYENSEVRTVNVDGEPWFVLADVCKVLEIKNTTDTAKRLDEDERSRLNLGRQGEAIIINESGLYAVILRSDKPQAKPFRKWVTSEVLPAIRKTGAYIPEQKQLTPIEMIASIANNAVETERRLNLAESKLNDMQTSIDNTSSKLNQALDVFTETFAVPDWSSCMNRRISAVIKQNGLNHQTERGNLYKELENLARCNLNVRKANKQKRMKKSGAKSKDIQAVSKLDVISDDAQLRAIFDGIVRKFEARYIQGDNVQMGIPEVIE